MENKNEAGRKAEGLILYSEWKQGALRGHLKIGKQICKDYNITQEDLDERKRLIWNKYQRLRRQRKKEEAHEKQTKPNLYNMGRLIKEELQSSIEMEEEQNQKEVQIK